MRVLFVVPYPPDTAPSQRFKFEQYLDFFRSQGITCTMRPFLTPSFYRIVYRPGSYPVKAALALFRYLCRLSVLLEVLRHDIVYIHLEAAPFGPPIFEHLVRWLGRPIIYDIDDMIFLQHFSEVNRVMKYLRRPEKVNRLMAMSDHVIVVTRPLEAYARRYNRHVTFIPPTINTEKYQVGGRAGGPACIGWSGSHSTVEFLRLIERPLRRISGTHKVRIKVIGDRNFQIEGLALDAQDWIRETEVADLQEFDIGLYPLPKNEWVLGKGGLKALQYMGVGVPPVCTHTVVNAEVVTDGVDGFLVETEEQWVDRLAMLIEDPALRQRMGLAARRTVEERYSVAKNGWKYLAALEEVETRRRGRRPRLRPQPAEGQGGPMEPASRVGRGEPS